ncbi:bet1-like protein [Dorcoceras hygrometricum]|uniref:Bet1-like protein n=1 Tax=Dorcoceras hygrometricum TaxID=472368 RepID=A0A2Z7CLP3_9LAMI|nr:bet1-like protein [Dorcoceras hygrometricum]
MICYTDPTTTNDDVESLRCHAERAREPSRVHYTLQQDYSRGAFGHPDVMIEVFSHGLQGGNFFISLIKKPPKTFDEILLGQINMSIWRKYCPTESSSRGLGYHGLTSARITKLMAEVEERLDTLKSDQLGTIKPDQIDIRKSDPFGTIKRDELGTLKPNPFDTIKHDQLDNLMSNPFGTKSDLLGTKSILISSTLGHEKNMIIPGGQISGCSSFLANCRVMYNNIPTHATQAVREGLSTRPAAYGANSDEIQLRIDPIHGDFDEEVTGLRKQVRRLRDVKFLNS